MKMITLNSFKDKNVPEEGSFVMFVTFSYTFYLFFPHVVF